MTSSAPGSGSMLVASAPEPLITVRPVTLRSPVADGNFSCEKSSPATQRWSPNQRMFGKGRYDI